MSGLVKKELLKHLAKYAKNVDPAKVTISTMRGEGELTNLQLDEQVIMDLLELPTWLAIKSASCNRLSIKIPWTSLKSKPVCFFLDLVEVEMVTCENLREKKPAEPSTPSRSAAPAATASPQIKYGFMERVIDGIYIHVNSVAVNFKSYAFAASIDLSQIIVESRGPGWIPVNDLRSTRVKDETRGQVIIFKHIQLGTLRIAVDAMDNNAASVPIRLISNNSSVSIGIKKRLTDCGFVASKVKLSLEDLLWVLNDTQIKAVICYVNMLKPLVIRASKQSQSTVAANQSVTGAGGASANSTAGYRLPRNDQEVALARAFDLNDIQETSYHLCCHRIDLHLTEDNSSASENSRLRLDGGAIQLTLSQLCVDHYPYHLVGQTFYHWENYCDLFESRNAWANNLLAQYKEKYTQATAHWTASQKRTSPSLEFRGRESLSVEGFPINAKAPKGVSAMANGSKLLSSCFVLWLDNFALHHVTSTSTSKVEQGKLLFSDKHTFHIPPDVPSLLAMYTDYYFAGASTSADASPTARAIANLPLPHGNMFVKVNPSCFDFHADTLVWLSSFTTRVSQDVVLPEADPNVETPHVDTRLELLMPQATIKAPNHPENQPDRPRGLDLQAAVIIVSNTQQGVSSEAKADLISSFKRGYMYNHGGTSCLPDNPGVEFMSEESLHYPTDVPFSALGKDSLRLAAKNDIWSAEVDQIWADWFGIKTTRSGKLPFLDPVSIKLWLTKPDKKTSLLTPDVNAGIFLNERLTVYLDHYQFLTLMRIQDMFDRVSDDIAHDMKALCKEGNLPKVELGKESLFGMLNMVDIVFLTVPSQPPPDDIPLAPVPPDSAGDIPDVLRDTLLSNAEPLESSPPVFAQTEIALPDTQSTGGSEDIIATTPEEQNSFSDPLGVSDVMQDDSSSQATSENRENLPVTSFTSYITPKEGTVAVNQKPLSFTASILSAGSLVASSGTRSSASSLLSVAKAAGSKAAGSFLTADNMSVAGSEFSVGSGYSSEDDFIYLSAEKAADRSGGSATRRSSQDSFRRAVDYDPEDEFLGNERKDQLVSAVIARMQNVECWVQALKESQTSIVSLAVPSLEFDQHVNTTLSQLYTSIAKYARENLSSSLAPGCNSEPAVQLRLDSASSSTEKLYGTPHGASHIHIKVSGLEAGLSMGCLMGVVDLVEEEKVASLTPLRVDIASTSIKLPEDRPPANSVTSPAEPPPLVLQFDWLSLDRGVDGVIRFKYDHPAPTPDSPSANQRDPDGGVSSLEEENARLRRQLAEFESRVQSLSNENLQLKVTLDNMQHILPPVARLK